MNKITQHQITFLSDIDRKFTIDKSEKYYYYKLNNFNAENVLNFLLQIKDNEIYLVFPFLTTSYFATDPFLRLSSQFLVTNQSNHKLIAEFLEHQWDNSSFIIEEGNSAFLYFKHKKVNMELKTLI